MANLNWSYIWLNSVFGFDHGKAVSKLCEINISRWDFPIHLFHKRRLCWLWPTIIGHWKVLLSRLEINRIKKGAISVRRGFFTSSGGQRKQNSFWMKIEIINAISIHLRPNHSSKWWWTLDIWSFSHIWSLLLLFFVVSQQFYLGTSDGKLIN